MKDNTLTLIRDAYGRICWLGKEAEPKPDKSWLKGQTIPFQPNAVFHSAYPLDGGAVIVDKNNVAVIAEFSGTAAAWEPRHATLVALWYAMNDKDIPITVPDGFLDYYVKKKDLPEEWVESSGIGAPFSP